ncbi:D-alanyl-D-alanine carboxypeptidase precursor [Aquisphaera giovannonii]|uniref:D-alanyl-D-alanine carboxypeptidase n=1 Tax=Aquisphaera giovannonii TaxID=406548 RepID=A0A5B9WE50_9BACT|nr:serine hydrolase domain-containing protein [Aquisphaera giovannonii]QEH38817.1 D-alanyl-D-alanine carboxypeptidase precursor [Aquisphaera giovannonii]
MLTRRPIAAYLVALVAIAPACHAADGRESLDATLAPYLERDKLPALAAAVAVKGEVVAAGAVGTRRAGEKIPVTLDDRFHIGSDTKAMTATLAGMLVDEGKLRWDSTVGELLPDLAAGLDPGVRGVRLAQLLSHTSGLPGDDEAFGELLGKSYLQEGNLDAMRTWLAKEYGKRPLATKPGAKFAYANMNYIIAGAAIERAAGRTWEELIRRRLFEPLGLRSAGLGNQASLGLVDAPLGHEERDGKVVAFLAGPNGDNPVVLGPAGTAHMSVLDFARWAAWNAGGGRRGPALVRPETLARLHAKVIDIPARKGTAPGTPTIGGYAMGWGEVNVPFSREPLLHHAGSNTKNLAQVWIDPRRDLAIVLMTNLGGDRADDALKKLAAELYGRYAGSAGRP